MTKGERILRLGPVAPRSFGVAEARLACEDLDRIASTLAGVAPILEQWNPEAAEVVRIDRVKALALARRLREVAERRERLAAAL